MVAVSVRSVQFVPDRWLIRIEPEEETLGDMLIRLRKARDWSQRDVARAIARPGDDIGTLQSLISRYESERISEPSADMIDRLAAAFDVSRHTIGYAAYQSKLRRERQPIPPNSLVIGPADPGLMQVMEALKEIEDEQLPAVAEHIRLVAEGRPPRPGEEAAG